jgi:hypothetical protein
MLNVAQVGNKREIGAQFVPVGEQTQTLCAAREHRRWMGQSDEWRFCYFADRNRVELGYTGLRHTGTSRTTRAT